MRVDVRAHGVELVPAMREYAADRMLAAVAHAAGRVVSILVVVSDENGPKGGEDKVCRAAAHLRTGGVVVVEHRDPRVGGAVDGSADRLRDAVDRLLDRREATRRRAKLERAVNRVMAVFGRGARL